MSVQDSAQTVKLLEKLKSAILNIDWEISNENIGILNQELAELRSVWQGQKVLMIYLQIMGALSQYIASTKEQGNPGAFSMLRAVFDSLEDMVVNPSAEEEQMKKVMIHVDAYNDLKKRVATGKTKPAPPPEPEPEVVAAPEETGGGEEQPSTINRLLDDKEDHTTDSIFDSMLDEMVQVEPPAAVVAPPPPRQAPPARPAVQAAYNKEDGTEIEADRNIDDKFAEADELLDDFFVDDVPAPGAARKKEGEEFDLGVLDEEEGAVLDLVHAGPEETGAAAPPQEEPLELDHVEDSDLDIFKVDEEELGPQEIIGTETAGFPEMESALDDFFAGEEAATPPPVVSASLERGGLGEDGGAVETALEDFFAETEAPEPVKPAVEEAPELEMALETAELEVAPVAVSVPAGTVAGLKALLLAVDWEVDDQFLDRIDAEISALTKAVAGNDVALIHLNFLNSVIHYVGREQSPVISESLACLKMVTESLEDLLSGERGESACAAKAVSSFVDWHELVVAEIEKRLEAAKAPGRASVEAGGEPVSEAEKPTELQTLKREIISEIREMLSLEMQTIRREISAKD